MSAGRGLTISVPGWFRLLLECIFDPKLIIRRRVAQLYEDSTSPTRQMALKWVEWGSF